MLQREMGQMNAAAGPTSAFKTRAERLSRARACAQCKRQKIKCEFRREDGACVRCLRAGLECVPYDPAKRLREEDAAWKTEAAANISQLQAAVNSILQRGQLADLSSFANESSQAASNNNNNNNTSPTSSALSSVSVRNAAISPIEMRREQSPEDEQQPDDPRLVPAPMTNLYELTRCRGNDGGNGPGHQPTTTIEDDIISQGLVSIHEAEKLFLRFLTNHQPFLWGGILFPYQNLTAVRQASTLLLTAILTVAALHTPGHTETLQNSYDTFVTLVSKSCLSRRHKLEDIRGLVLAAFYLPNLSWRLSGQAARMAAEMNIHHSFQRLMNGDTNQTERVRVWYALYVCDRHFSIAYGRPSAMYDDAAIRGVEQFIQSPTAEVSDMRMCAQVALFKILTEAFLEFGTDQTQALSGADLDRLRTYNMAIEQWRMLWQPRSPDNAAVGAYPSCGIVLHYHFARFQLNSLALRGIRWPPSDNGVFGDATLSINRREAVITGISAAMSTLTYVLRERDLRRAMPSVPLFTHTLVAFCATFLLKLTCLLGQRGSGVRGDVVAQSLGFEFNVQEVLRLTCESVDLLSEVAEMVSEKHITRLVAAGIREALQKVETLDESKANGTAMQQQNEDAIKGDVSTGPTTKGGMVYSTAATGRTQYSDQMFPGVETTGQQHVGDSMDELTYNMDMNDLVGMLENGFDETFLGPFMYKEFDHWGPSI